MLKADLHIHSNISDGSDSIEELAKNIKLAKFDVVALTDHDTVAGIEKMKSLIPDNIRFIKGIELTCTADNGLKSHVLGFNCDIKNKELLNLIAKGKILRRKKMETRIEFLKNVWNIELTKEELEWLYSRETVVKTHFGIILVNRGLSDNLIDAMDKYFDGCKTGNTRFDTKEAIDAIISAGGVPVWAHPLGGEGEKHIEENLFLQRLEKMISLGIKGLECYYSRYNFDEIEILLRAAKNNNLLISGGSDYHGANKTIPLGRLNIDDEIIDGNKLSILKY
ncbi:MAG: PHP domain-containing protein [Candidatus Gastranaerophilales bacterium]|nr:PHP domain-containing protein [Candidatus Gastranaerophilales bacterium]